MKAKYEQSTGAWGERGRISTTEKERRRGLRRPRPVAAIYEYGSGSDIGSGNEILEIYEKDNINARRWRHIYRRRRQKTANALGNETLENKMPEVGRSDTTSFSSLYTSIEEETATKLQRSNSTGVQMSNTVSTEPHTTTKPESNRGVRMCYICCEYNCNTFQHPGMSIEEEKRIRQEFQKLRHKQVDDVLEYVSKEKDVCQIEVIPVGEKFEEYGMMSYAELDGTGMVFVPSLTDLNDSTDSRGTLPWWLRDTWTDTITYADTIEHVDTLDNYTAQHQEHNNFCCMGGPFGNASQQPVPKPSQYQSHKQHFVVDALKQNGFDRLWTQQPTAIQSDTRRKIETSQKSYDPKIASQNIVISHRKHKRRAEVDETANVNNYHHKSVHKETSAKNVRSSSPETKRILNFEESETIDTFDDKSYNPKKSKRKSQLSRLKLKRRVKGVNSDTSGRRQCDDEILLRNSSSRNSQRNSSGNSQWNHLRQNRSGHGAPTESINMYCSESENASPPQEIGAPMLPSLSPDLTQHTRRLQYDQQIRDQTMFEVDVQHRRQHFGRSMETTTDLESDYVVHDGVPMRRNDMDFNEEYQRITKLNEVMDRHDQVSAASLHSSSYFEGFLSPNVKPATETGNGSCFPGEIPKTPLHLRGVPPYFERAEGIFVSQKYEIKFNAINDNATLPKGKNDAKHDSSELDNDSLQTQVQNRIKQDEISPFDEGRVGSPIELLEGHPDRFGKESLGTTANLDHHPSTSEDMSIRRGHETKPIQQLETYLRANVDHHPSSSGGLGDEKGSYDTKQLQQQGLELSKTNDSTQAPCTNRPLSPKEQSNLVTTVPSSSPARTEQSAIPLKLLGEIHIRKSLSGSRADSHARQRLSKLSAQKDFQNEEPGPSHHQSSYLPLSDKSSSTIMLHDRYDSPQPYDAERKECKFPEIEVSDLKNLYMKPPEQLQSAPEVGISPAMNKRKSGNPGGCSSPIVINDPDVERKKHGLFCDSADSMADDMHVWSSTSLSSKRKSNSQNEATGALEESVLMGNVSGSGLSANVPTSFNASKDVDGIKETRNRSVAIIDCEMLEERQDMNFEYRQKNMGDDNEHLKPYRKVTEPKNLPQDGGKNLIDLSELSTQERRKAAMANNGKLPAETWIGLLSALGPKKHGIKHSEKDLIPPDYSGVLLFQPTINIYNAGRSSASSEKSRSDKSIEGKETKIGNAFENDEKPVPTNSNRIIDQKPDKIEKFYDIIADGTVTSPNDMKHEDFGFIHQDEVSGLESPSACQGWPVQVDFPRSMLTNQTISERSTKSSFDKCDVDDNSELQKLVLSEQILRQELEQIQKRSAQIRLHVELNKKTTLKVETLKVDENNEKAQVEAVIDLAGIESPDAAALAAENFAGSKQMTESLKLDNCTETQVRKNDIVEKHEIIDLSTLGNEKTHFKNGVVPSEITTQGLPVASAYKNWTSPSSRLVPDTPHLETCIDAVVDSTVRSSAASTAKNHVNPSTAPGYTEKSNLSTTRQLNKNESSTMPNGSVSVNHTNSVTDKMKENPFHFSEDCSGKEPSCSVSIDNLRGRPDKNKMVSSPLRSTLQDIRATIESESYIALISTPKSESRKLPSANEIAIQKSSSITSRNLQSVASSHENSGMIEVISENDYDSATESDTRRMNFSSVRENENDQKRNGGLLNFSRHKVSNSHINLNNHSTAENCSDDYNHTVRFASDVDCASSSASSSGLPSVYHGDSNAKGIGPGLRVDRSDEPSPLTRQSAEDTSLSSLKSEFAVYGTTSTTHEDDLGVRHVPRRAIQEMYQDSSKFSQGIEGSDSLNHQLMSFSGVQQKPFRANRESKKILSVSWGGSQEITNTSLLENRELWESDANNSNKPNDHSIRKHFAGKEIKVAQQVQRDKQVNAVRHWGKSSAHRGSMEEIYNESKGTASLDFTHHQNEDQGMPQLQEKLVGRKHKPSPGENQGKNRLLVSLPSTQENTKLSRRDKILSSMPSPENDSTDNSSYSSEFLPDSFASSKESSLNDCISSTSGRLSPSRFISQQYLGFAAGINESRGRDSPTYSTGSDYASRPQMHEDYSSSSNVSSQQVLPEKLANYENFPNTRPYSYARHLPFLSSKEKFRYDQGSHPDRALQTQVSDRWCENGSSEDDIQIGYCKHNAHASTIFMASEKMDHRGYHRDIDETLLHSREARVGLRPSRMDDVRDEDDAGYKTPNHEENEKLFVSKARKEILLRHHRQKVASREKECDEGSKDVPKSLEQATLHPRIAPFTVHSKDVPKSPEQTAFRPRRRDSLFFPESKPTPEPSLAKKVIHKVFPDANATLEKSLNLPSQELQQSIQPESPKPSLSSWQQRSESDSPRTSPRSSPRFSRLEKLRKLKPMKKPSVPANELMEQSHLSPPRTGSPRSRRLFRTLATKSVPRKSRSSIIPEAKKTQPLKHFVEPVDKTIEGTGREAVKQQSYRERIIKTLEKSKSKRI